MAHEDWPAGLEPRENGSAYCPTCKQVFTPAQVRMLKNMAEREKNQLWSREEQLAGIDFFVWKDTLFWFAARELWAWDGKEWVKTERPAYLEDEEIK